MDSAKLNDWLQVIGVFGVIASLIFVGLQLRQTYEIALANQYNERAAARQAIYAAMLESGFDYTVFGKPMNELSIPEFNAQRAYASWVWTTMDNLHFQHQAGFLPDESRDVMERIIRSAKDSEMYTSVLEQGKASYRSSFLEAVEQIWREAGD